MDERIILSEFKGSPNVLKGLANMLAIWRRNQLDIGLKKESFYFKCSTKRVAFRVEFPKAGKVPRIVVYSGVNDANRGSPLIKGANKEDVDKLKYLLGISNEETEKPDWKRELYENTSEEFYHDFINYALSMCEKV
jgi:hypothetical protein